MFKFEQGVAQIRNGTGESVGSHVDAEEIPRDRRELCDVASTCTEECDAAPNDVLDTGGGRDLRRL